MNKIYTIDDIIAILNSLELRGVDSDESGHCIVSSIDGDVVYTTDIAEAFGLKMRYVAEDGYSYRFVKKETLMS